MSEMTIVVVKNGDEWEGWYKNGKLLDQDHNFSAEDILRLLGIPYKVKHTDTDGLLPKQLAQL